MKGKKGEISWKLVVLIILLLFLIGIGFFLATGRITISDILGKLNQIIRYRIFS